MLNIDNLKSMISKKGGLAPLNRFNVIFRPPTQALLNINAETIVASALSGTANIQNLINDPRDISLLCESVTLPSREISTLDSIQGMQQNKFPYTFVDSDVTMTFMITNDYYIRLLFDAWMKTVFDVEKYQAGYKNDYAVDIVIQHLNQKNIPIYGVKLEKAFPMSVSGIELSNDSSDYAKLTVTFAYDKFKPEGPVSSTASAIREAIPTSFI